MPARPVPLQAVLGRRLRELRERDGRTQEQLAADVRELGWPATRVTIAKAETGRVQLELEELLILAMALCVPLSEFADPSAESIAVRNGAIRGGALRDVLAGASGGDLQPKVDFSSPAISLDWWREKMARSDEALKERVAEAEKVWPGRLSLRTFFDAEKDAEGEVERKAAHTLGLTPLQVALLARRLWGRGLTEHRDQLAGQDASHVARGHVTRRLLGDLRAAMEAGNGSA